MAPHSGNLIGVPLWGALAWVLGWVCPMTVLDVLSHQDLLLTVTKTKIKRFSEVNSDVSIYFHVQSNLGDSNADFSKPPDFSNLTVSPDLFCYHLM